MKRIISVLLVFSLLAGLLAFSASAVNAYPESKHDYDNNTWQSWSYKSEKPVSGMYVTFSDECYVQPYVRYTRGAAVPEDKLTDEMIRSIAVHGIYEEGDLITISSDDYGTGDIGCYTGSELAGQTVYIPGNYFEIELESDSSVTGYGFKVDKIEYVEFESDGVGIVNYIIDGKVASYDYATENGMAVLDETYHNYHEGSEAIVGWKTEDGKEFYYSNTKRSVIFNEEDYSVIQSGYGTDVYVPVEDGAVCNLYPIYCKLGMTSEETFSFTNSDDVFGHDFGGYVYTQETFRHQFIDWLADFGFSPLFPLALVALVINTVYWPNDGFSGSCCGFPIAAILQHEGKIDLLSEQGVDKVSDLEPTDELQSTINFYNNAAVAAHLVNHWAFDPGTKEYTRQLKDLYATLEEGTPVYFEFYPGSQPPIKSIADHFKYHTDGSFIDAIDGAHGILMCGAFTDNDGNHVLLGWDNNSEAYSEGYADVIVIDKDFTTITYVGPEVSYQREPLLGFAWNDDLSTFESFPTEGLPNPFPWHINFIEHIFELICHSITNLSVK